MSPLAPPPPPPAPPARSTPGAGLRPLWRIGGTVLAVAALAFGTLQVVVRLGHSEEVVAATFDQPGLRVVEVSLERGSVRVIGTDRATVSVAGRVSHGLVATRHAEEVRGDRLVVTSSCNRVLSAFCSTDYTIEVPSAMSVVARTSHDDVVVSNLGGPVDLATDHGDVQVDRVAGDAVLATEHGSVDALELGAARVRATSEHGSVRLDFARPPTEVVARSDHGSVEVVVPDAPVDYAVEVSSWRGSASSPVRTDPDSARRITATSEHGDAVVRYP